MIKEEMQKELAIAMKAGGSVHAKGILRVALGEIQKEEMREGKYDNDKAIKIVKKLHSSNKETMEALSEHTMTDMDDRYDCLHWENECLSRFLPKELSEEEIISQLEGVAQQIREANNDGMAIGMAMKHFKSNNITVDGKKVKSVVGKLRE